MHRDVVEQRRVDGDLGGFEGTYAKSRYLNYGSENSNPHNGLLVSVLSQFGMNLSSFGDAAFTGELADL